MYDMSVGLRGGRVGNLGERGVDGDDAVRARAAPRHEVQHLSSGFRVQGSGFRS